MKRKTFIFALLLMIISYTAIAGSVNVVQNRYLPESYTEPQVTSNDRTTSYKPSIPTGFKKYSFSSSVQVKSATVHDSDASSNKVEIPNFYYLNFRDGSRKLVKKNDIITINDEPYLVQGVIGNNFCLQSVSTKIVIKLAHK